MAYLTGILAGFAAARVWWRRTPNYRHGGPIVRPVFAHDYVLCVSHGPIPEDVIRAAVRRMEREYGRHD